MQQLETRFKNMELESTSDGLRVSGYLNKTNQLSEVLGVRKKFIENIMPGKFERALQNGSEIHFLAEHDNAKILSSTRNGSLNLREGENGLYMEANIAPTSWGNDYHTLIKEGIIQNMSFGMKVLKDSWKKFLLECMNAPFQIFTLQKFQLFVIQLMFNQQSKQTGQLKWSKNRKLILLRRMKIKCSIKK
ncbi:HK97 family phage prohead protease [Bacillus altitudinis]|uniref:HK97 family phage prohead protease n=1 Tax=Bacillus altitudinis TaxID=293387 RepID=UPI00398240CE